MYTIVFKRKYLSGVKMKPYRQKLINNNVLATILHKLTLIPKGLIYNIG